MSEVKNKPLSNQIKHDGDCTNIHTIHTIKEQVKCLTKLKPWTIVRNIVAEILAIFSVCSNSLTINLRNSVSQFVPGIKRYLHKLVLGKLLIASLVYY